MIRRRLLVAMLAGWLVAACGSTTPAPSLAEPSAGAPTSTQPAASAPATAPSPPARPSPPPVDQGDTWARLTSTIQRDGTVPLETALKAFALLVGPLPGAEAPTGDPPPVSSGSGAIRWLLGHWDELTPSQRAGVEAALAPEQQPTTSLGAGRLVASLGLAQPIAAAPTCPPGKESTRQAEFDGQVDQAKSAVAAMLGRELKLPVSVVFRGLGPVAANTVGLDASCNIATARPALCQIQVTNRGEGLIAFEFIHLVAHEVFHCYQYDFATSYAAALRVSPWLAEGSAAWVGETISGNSTLGAEYWEGWLKYPAAQLFARSYDGIGFFMHLQESGIDPWPLLIAMHKNGETSSADAYAVAVKGGAAGPMLDAWGPSYIRDLSLRPDWSTGGPGLPEAVRTPIGEGSLADGETAAAGADPLAASALKLDLQAESLVIEELFAAPSAAHGLIRFADGKQMTLEEAAGKPFCLKPGGCTCPDGSAGSGHAWQPASQGQMLFGLAGHTDGVDVWLHGMPVDITCAQAPEDFVPEEPCWCPPGPLGTRNAAPATIARARPTVG
jgi:hypothetical protein